MLLLDCASSQADGTVLMAATRPERPVASEGIISVSQRDLELGLPLAGEWEIYQGSLLSPEDFRRGLSLEPEPCDCA